MLTCKAGITDVTCNNNKIVYENILKNYTTFVEALFFDII
jgi:hypothetical protein